ncbi:4Fe-4S binding protein [Mesorhizobium japonicum]|nr:4Fe-4S binding protein [Mesorhizobium japonicum]
MVEACTRCGKCAEVCPSNSARRHLGCDARRPHWRCSRSCAKR